MAREEPLEVVGSATVQVGYESQTAELPLTSFAKARSVPYALRQKVDRLVAEGILEPIEYSNWAAPIVAVVKSDKKSVRICEDFCTTVNAVS